MDEGGEAERQAPASEERSDEDQPMKVRDSQGDQRERRKHSRLSSTSNSKNSGFFSPHVKELFCKNEHEEALPAGF